jgi:dipeptidyl aminopeptidase/acylaminoacyl peptidase
LRQGCAVHVEIQVRLLSRALYKHLTGAFQRLKRLFDLRVGDVDKEEDFLKSRSPLFAADRIDIPMLIAQGANDPRVKVAEAEQIVAALRAKGTHAADVLAEQIEKEAP